MTLADLAMPTLRDSRLDGLPVAIIGAGPIGLAAAAQLHERGIDFRDGIKRRIEELLSGILHRAGS